MTIADPHAARDELAKIGASLNPSTFGTYVTTDKQGAANMVLLCYNLGYGEQTVQIALPHQIYVEKLKKLLEEHPNLTSVSITPLDVNKRVTISREIVEAL